MTARDLGPVVLDLKGLELLPEEKEIIAHPKVGGIVLFARNYLESAQLRDLVRSVKEVRETIVIAVDQEGGRVQRFKDADFTRIPAMQTIGNRFGADSSAAAHCATELGWLMSVELIAHGVDFSFAPVLDVDGGVSEVIGDRSFSSDCDAVTGLAGHFIKGMSEAGMKSTGKHFPGHGTVGADSHLELPVDTRSFAQIQAQDLVPFARLANDLDAVMSAHILFPEIDPDIVTFSPYWLKQCLRDDLGFGGLVFSDDLSMSGADGLGSYSERARRALDAGCDSVLVCNQPDHAIAVIEDLESDSRYHKPCGLEKMLNCQSYKLNTLRDSKRWQSARELSETLL